MRRMRNLRWLPSSLTKLYSRRTRRSSRLWPSRPLLPWPRWKTRSIDRGHITPEVFASEVREWVETAKQPKFGISYTKLVYKPMLELLDYLKAHDFRVFVCSGGGLDFMRVFSEKVLSVAKTMSSEPNPSTSARTGSYSALVSFSAASHSALPKPSHIYSRTGSLPAFAGGNMAGDIEMLEVSKFALLINHDDHNREFEYTKGAEKALAMPRNLGGRSSA